jgi:branched-chain amino acid transport system permease protein
MPDLSPFVVSGLGAASTYVLAGVGLVVLYRASGVLNFAQGAIGALGAFIAWTLIDVGGAQVVGWLAGVSAAVAVSLIYGRLLAPRLAHSDPVVRSVATLAFALILLGSIEFLWGETPRRLRLPIDTMGIEIFAVRITFPRALALVTAIVTTLAVAAFLRYSRMGLSMRALANNRELSALLGVRVLQADAWAWTISGLLAGASGLMLANLERLSGIALTFQVIPAVAAAVIGRFKSLPATVAGGTLIGVAEALLTPFPDVAPYRSAVAFAIAVVALLWIQRRGAPIFGS